MTTQTKTWQRQILESARRDNYTGLYWYIELQLNYRTHVSAAHPGRYVPLVPVGPDPEISRHWAHLLCELFRAGNPPPLQFEPALTSTEALEQTGIPHYVWGERLEVDAICALCGCVERVDAELLAMSPVWCCGGCAGLADS